MNKRIFLSPPHMGGNELKYIEDVFKDNYIAPLGKYVDKFESDVCSYVNGGFGAALSSGTAALHLALKILGVQKDDEVLASTLTFIGSVSPITFVDAKVVFIDSDYKSWNLDPKLLEEYLKNSPKVKALIVTHLYGQTCDIEEIANICKRYGIYLIEDAAESLGAKFNNQQTGTFGDFGVFSFNGNKILTTSGGGVLISKNKNYIEKAKFLATQARDSAPWYEHTEIGFNYRLSNVCAAIGVGQMEVLDQRIKRKREIFDLYMKELKEIKEITFMPELKNSVGIRWLSAILIDLKSSVTPESLRVYLEEYNIESRPLWKPMHMQKVFKDAKVVGGSVSEDIFKRGLCLPSGTSMSDEDVLFVSDLIKKKFQN